MRAIRKHVPELVRCALCGNRPTDDADLVYDDTSSERRVIHNRAPCDDATDDNGDRIYPDDDPDTPIPVCGHVECQEDWDPCPPLADGFGKCFRCEEARPLHALTFTTAEECEPGKGEFGSTTRILSWHIPADSTRDDFEYAIDTNTDLPLLMCLNGCPARREEASAHVPRDEATGSAKDQATQDVGRGDAVPADGPGSSLADLMALWNVSQRTAERVTARLLDAGTLRFSEVPTRAGGRARRVYWRVVS